MNPRTRTGIIFAILGILIIVGGVFVLLSFIRQTLAPLPPPTPEPVITEKVVVATHDLALGALLGPDDLTEIDVPVEVIPRNALKNIEGAIGRYTTIPLVTGEIVLSHHLGDPTNINHDLAFTLADDQVLMAIPANDLMSRLNIIQRGDIVDLLVTIDETVTIPADTPGEEDREQSRQFTFDALQLVEVTAMVVEVVTEGRQTSPSIGVEDELAQPTPQPSEVNVEAYLLALSPQDALVIKHLQDARAIFDVVLRSPTSVQLFDLDPVSSEYLIDRYELEILP